MPPEAKIKEYMTSPPEPYRLNLPVTFESILYLLSKGHRFNRYHLLKMIYYADRKHLFDYGAPITGDSLMAMSHGPVPSTAYDIVKAACGEGNCLSEKVQFQVVDIIGSDEYGGNFYPKREPNLDYLSPSAKGCLDWAFDHVLPKSFQELKDETHLHSGFKAADENDNMSTWEIIKDAEDPESLREYLEEALDGSNS